MWKGERAFSALSYPRHLFGVWFLDRFSTEHKEGDVPLLPVQPHGMSVIKKYKLAEGLFESPFINTQWHNIKLYCYENVTKNDLTIANYYYLSILFVVWSVKELFVAQRNIFITRRGLFSCRFRATKLKSVWQASVFCPQQMKKWRPTEVSVFSQEEERSRSIWSRRCCWEWANTGRRTATIKRYAFFSHSENNKPVSVNSTRIKLNYWTV